MTLNAEGDVHVSDETIENTGTRKFLTPLFGSLWALYPKPVPRTQGLREPIACECPYLLRQNMAKEGSYPWHSGPSPQTPYLADRQPTVTEEDIAIPHKAKLLTDLLPEPGYFVAGGVAGVVSRTVTAPLDRLKVYLIAQVGVKHEAVLAAKVGAPVQAAKTATRPIIEATKQLWRMGGMRSMFAGNASRLLLCCILFAL